MSRLLACVALLAAASRWASAQTLAPNDVDGAAFRSVGNKFASRSLRDPLAEAKKELFGTDSDVNGKCDYEVHMSWSTQLGSSVYATPLITDLFSDGKRDVIVPTVTHYLEAVEGVTGHDVGQFPFVHPHLHTQSSPVAVDIDGDGINEYMIATVDGTLVFVNEEGSPVVGRSLKIPPAHLPKNWKATTQVATTQPDNYVTTHAAEAKAQEVFNKMALQPRPRRQKELALNPTTTAKNTLRRPMQEEGGDGDGGDLGQAYEDYYNRMYDERFNGAPSGYGEYDDIPHPYGDDYGYGDEDVAENVEVGTDGWLSDEARASMDLVFHPNLYKSSLNLRNKKKDVFAPMNNVSLEVPSGMVSVDAHILSTPAVVDLDADGNFEVLVTVSYYFDEEDYAGHGRELPVEDPENYVASGIVCMDITTGKVQWSHILHVTTKNSPYPAYAVSAPLIVNADASNHLDIFVTTTHGLIMSFEASGAKRKGWPVAMGPIISSPVAVDINADGQIEICAGDTKGNLACFSRGGNEMAEMQLSGSIVATPTAGAILGDGVVALVVGTTEGLVYAVNLMDRKILPNFPVATQGPIVASALVVGLNNAKASPVLVKQPLSVVVPSLDGNVYIINPVGCYEMIDLGEKSYGMVLADDLSGSGKLQLLVATISGRVSVYETGTPFHPLKQWLSKPNSLNGMTAKEYQLGVFIEPESRVARDVRGDHFELRITIYDDRAGKFTTYQPRYIVYIMLGKQLVVMSSLLFRPGSHTLRVPAPVERIYTTVNVVMATPNAMRFEDSVALSFNMHFLDGAKFTLVIPFFLWCFALYFVKKEHTIIQSMDPVDIRRYRQAQALRYANRA